MKVSLDVDRIIEPENPVRYTKRDILTVEIAPDHWDDKSYNSNAHLQYASLTIGGLIVIVRRDELVRALNSLT